jgi:hypothetical protein
MALISDYTARITSEHTDKSDYVQTVSISVQPMVEIIGVIDNFTSDFDIDTAIGVQEDAVGVRVGRDRYVTVPFNVYFSIGVAGLGLGQGVLKGSFDPTTGLTKLPDDIYRIILYAKVKADMWDGTIPGAYDAWNTLLSTQTGSFVLIQDWGDASFGVVLVGVSPLPLTTAIFQSSGLDRDLKPATMSGPLFQASVFPAAVVGGTPVFGIGVESTQIAGIGVGALITRVSPILSPEFILGISLLGGPDVLA